MRKVLPALIFVASVFGLASGIASAAEAAPSHTLPPGYSPIQAWSLFILMLLTIITPVAIALTWMVELFGRKGSERPEGAERAVKNKDLIERRLNPSIILRDER